MQRNFKYILSVSVALGITSTAHAGIGDFFSGLFGGEKKPEVIKPAEAKEIAAKPAAKAVTEKVKGQIAAKFSTGEVVTLENVKQTLASLPPQISNLPFEKVYPLLLKHAIDTKMISIEARKKGFDKNADVKTAQKERKRALILKTFIEEEVKKTITDADLEQKYEELKKMLPPNEQEYRVSHIMLKNEAEAKKLVGELRAKKITFEAALEKSLDKQTKTKSGELGWIRRLDVPAPMWAKVEKAKDGEIVDTPLTLGKLGFSVIRVNEHRKVTPPPLAEIKNDLIKAMTPELSAKVIKNLKADANVKMFGLDGAELPERSEEELRKALEKDQPSTIDASTLSDTMTAATYKGGKITLRDVKDSLKSLPTALQSIPIEKIYELLVIRAVNNAVLEEAAKKAGVEKDPKLKSRIDFEMESVVQNAFLEDQAGKMITESDLGQQYSKVVKSLKAKNEMEYRLRHILVGSSDQAKDIMKRLKRGEKFDALVSLSTDEGTKFNNGDIGYVRKNMLPKAFGDAITRAAKGTLLREPINLGDKGYSIVRVEDKRAVAPPAFEQVKAELERGLKAEKAIKVVEELRTKIKVEKFDINGKPMNADEKTTETKAS